MEKIDFENLKILLFSPENVFLKGFPYKPTISDGWFIRKSFKGNIFGAKKQHFQIFKINFLHDEKIFSSNFFLRSRI